MNESLQEYYILKKNLEEITWALEGSCNDIDCDKYAYRDLLKKRYKPVLKHGISCLPSLKKEKEAVLRLLSFKKFRKLRYKRCEACKKKMDSLGKEYTIVSFLRPNKLREQKVYEYKGLAVHRACKKKIQVLTGWKKGF